MTQPRQLATMIRRRTRARFAALAFALCATSAAELTSASSLTVSEVETQDLEFLDVQTCAVDGGDGLAC